MSERDGSSVDRVIAWLRRHITRRKLGVGDPLPKEIEIASAVGVARSSVREALTGLKVLGIIESRRRGGIRIIRDPVLLDLREWFSDRYDDPAMLRTVMEFRVMLERGIAELSAVRMAAGDVGRLRRLLEDMPPGAGADEVIVAEKQFHTTLAHGSRNELVRLLSTLFSVAFDSVPRTPVATGAVWREGHVRLVEALERKDAAAFAKLIHDHTKVYITAENSPRSR
jgi:GntR family transcriptional regulator, transcriptional repressor for pyruvate dehydrogenase complex